MKIEISIIFNNEMPASIISFPFLLAEIGSTNGRWLLFTDPESYMIINTNGYSPTFSNSEIMPGILDTVKNGISGTVRTIHYYGTGCFHENPAHVVYHMLSNTFPGAEIKVRSDLEAAAFALSGNEEGWIGILGTGSSLAHWNGERLRLVDVSKGSNDSDPGSGTHIGALLLRHFHNGDLTWKLKDDLIKKFPVIVDWDIALSRSSGADKKVASLAKWVFDNAENHPDLEGMISVAFRSFCKHFLRNNIHEENTEIKFNGSIAYYGQKWLQQELSLYGFKLGKVIDSPLDGLVNYYKGIFHEKRH